MGLLDAQSVYRAYRTWRTAASWHVFFCDGVLLLPGGVAGGRYRRSVGHRLVADPFRPDATGSYRVTKKSVCPSCTLPQLLEDQF
jgi:hypothetical protein